MKKSFSFLPILAMALTSVASASSGPLSQQIHEALNVDETALGRIQMMKSVGGLTCIRDLGEKPRFDCSLSVDNRGARAIYTALDTEERDVTEGRLGATTTQKTVGSLTCEKVVVVAPGLSARFDCWLSREGAGR